MRERKRTRENEGSEAKKTPLRQRRKKRKLLHPVLQGEE